MSMQTVGQLGESGLLALVQQFCPVAVIGDDGALVTASTGHQLVVTTDVLVDGVHFSLGQALPGVITMSPMDVGWRAAAANLSDLAAMGAIPLGITVGLSLPADVPVAWVEAMYQGLTACLENHQTPIIGGDLCRSSIISLAITALGQVRPAEAIQRHTAQPGDAILVTGVHGASRAGLELLLHPAWGEGFTAETRNFLIQAHQRPQPRLDVIQQLRTIFGSIRVAGIDSSDGLADALIQLCQQSGTGAKINGAAIALVPELPVDVRLPWGLYGGEDFQLVLALELQAAETLQNHLGFPATIIGQMTSTPEIAIMTAQDSFNLDPRKRFQHFSPPDLASP